uniref:Ig-like domain-containing protein n=1 Tax=Sphaeramia orbicularis TaxID=375764 RepID=A0A672Z9V6_9TELE
CRSVVLILYEDVKYIVNIINYPLRSGNFPSDHSLKFLVAQSFGVKNFPEFVGVMMADDVEVGYCDSNNLSATPKTDWMKDLMEAEAEFKEWFDSHCHSQQKHLSLFIDIIMKLFQHSEGIHTFQMMTSFEMKGDSGDLISHFHWWDRDYKATTDIMTHLSRHCPDLLKKYSLYGNSSLLRTELPSVYLLQKSPLSPITCHATGFYPNKAKMFWRKDGEEIHSNDTELPKSLPNNDDTFQMSVNLNISSIQPKDWDKYDCVFQLLGVQHSNVTKLDKAVIRTNWKTTQSNDSNTYQCHSQQEPCTLKKKTKPVNGDDSNNSISIFVLI